MNSACGAWVTFQRGELPILRFNKVKADLACVLILFHKSLDPLKYRGMIHVLKDNCCISLRCKSGWICGVRGDVPIVANAVGVVLLA